MHKSHVFSSNVVRSCLWLYDANFNLFLGFLKKFHYFILNYQGLLALSDLDMLPLDLFKSIFLFDLESLS